MKLKTFISIFVGVRYAKAPVGDLRFEKPVEYPRWQGVRNANKTGNQCYQITLGMCKSN